MQGFDIVQRAETTQKALEARMGFMRGNKRGVGLNTSLGSVR